ncbi:MAG: hypothetical protein AB7L66_03810 [Gemmatimonadales bacterium]
MRRRTVIMVLAVPALVACRAEKPAAAAAGDTLTTRERQEAIGRSGLPGAVGIDRAIKVADSATAATRVLDSIGNQEPQP